MSGKDVPEFIDASMEEVPFEFTPCPTREDVEEQSSDDSCSDEEAKIDDCIIKKSCVSEDATISHIVDHFEGIDQALSKTDTSQNVPSDELIEKMVKQVEYYFSDENIVKDDYLLKLIKQSKTNFVSLAVVASFNKMKKLTKNWKDVAYAVEKASTKLVLDEKKKGIKRVDPLPEMPHKAFGDAGRIVVATALPSTSADDLQKLFQQCGKVTEFLMITSEAEFPPAVRDLLSNQRRGFPVPLVLAEYAKAEMAQAASRTLTDGSDWRRGLRVEVLLKSGKAPGKYSGKDKENKGGVVAESADQQKNKQQKKKKKKKIGPGQSAEKSQGDNPDLEKSSSPAERGCCMAIPIKKRESFSSSPKHPSSLGSSPRASHGKFAHHLKSPLAAEMDDDARMRSNSFGPSGHSPWMQKKLQEQTNAGGNSAPTVGKDGEVSMLKNLLVGIVRIPRGPGDEKGFKVHRTLP